MTRAAKRQSIVRVTVTTVDMRIPPDEQGGRVITDERTINMNSQHDKTWLMKHLDWALRHKHGVQFSPLNRRSALLRVLPCAIIGIATPTYGVTAMDIKDEFAALEQGLLVQPTHYIDYDGKRVDMPFTDEQEKAFARMSMLEDLMSLSIPLAETTWGLDMKFGMCPCTPALQAYQESMACS